MIAMDVVGQTPTVIGYGTVSATNRVTWRGAVYQVNTTGKTVGNIVKILHSGTTLVLL